MPFVYQFYQLLPNQRLRYFDSRSVFYNPPLQPTCLLLGSPMIIHGALWIIPHPSQQHADLQHGIIKLQQDVTRPKAQFKPTLHEKSVVDWGASRGQHILVSCFMFVPTGYQFQLPICTSLNCRSVYISNSFH